LLAAHSRPVAGMGGILPIPISEVKAICEVYDATIDDFERILRIERAVFPILQDNSKTDKKDKQEAAPKPLPYHSGKRR
jgi:hypothetical protein